MTKMENGEKTSQGLCIKCAKDLGLPIENMLGDMYKKMGISPEQLEDMEDELGAMMPSGDEGEDGGAPAIDIPKLFKDSGLADLMNSAANGEGGNIVPVDPQKQNGGKGTKNKNQPKQYKYLTTYCKNLIRLSIKKRI